MNLILVLAFVLLALLMMRPPRANDPIVIYLAPQPEPTPSGAGAALAFVVVCVLVLAALAVGL